MASSGVLISDVVISGVFPAFSTGLSVSDTFNMCGEVVTRSADNKGNAGFIDVTGDGCQGVGCRSLTCVMF